MKDNYFFDNAATSFPKPEVVYRFMDSFARTTAVNPGRSGYALSIESEQMVHQTRRMIGSFFNFEGDPARVVFTQNITDALNVVLQSLLKNGGHVVTTAMEHNSVLRPLAHFSDEGLAVTHLDADENGYIDVQQLDAACRADTCLVVVNHGSNVTGAVQQLQAISDVCTNRGIPLLLDTAQTAGVVPIDLAKTPVDFLAFTGHKGLFGPMGIGGLVVNNTSIEIQPSRVGGTGVDSIQRLHPQDYPHRLEAGTLAVPAIAGLHAAQQWFASLGTHLLDAIDSTSESAKESSDKKPPINIAEFNPAIDLETAAPAKNHTELCHLAQRAIAQHELNHIDHLVKAIKDHPRIRLLGQQRPDAARVATVGLAMEHITATKLADRLDDEYHVCVRAGLHCAPMAHQQLGSADGGGALRIAPGVFTTEDDINHLITALTELAET